MYDNEPRGDYNNMNNASAGYEGDRGEYRYKNGYTQRIYSDARYVPEDESYVPPRYYTPPEDKPPKAPKEPKVKKPKQKKGISVFAALCMCLVCSLVGGLCGASAAEMRFNEKLVELESRINDTQALPEAASESAEPASAAEAAPAVLTVSDDMTITSPSAIYDAACRQVVGITTEVTYTNLFGQTSSSAVTGTGFFVTGDGYILTNYHVIEYAAEYGCDVAVITHDGTRYTAQVVGTEESNDIAVLKVDVPDAVPATLGDSDSLYVGDEVYAVGNPLGELEFSMTFGRVSALDRLIAAADGEPPINMFQFDAAVNSGNSGGPVYNEVGDVIGIVTAKYKSSGVEGLGFAIPINDAVKIANELIANGYVSGKAKIGLSLDHRFTSVYSRYYGLPEGAYVSAVEAGGCAEAAGIKAGDIIVGIGDYKVRSHTDVDNAVKRFGAGDAADITVYRSGEVLTLTIVFDEYIPATASSAAAYGSGKR